MANPTPAKPATCELNSGDPLFTLIKAFLPMHEGVGWPRNIVTQHLPVRMTGPIPGSGVSMEGVATGRAPTWVTNGLASGFTFKFGNGSVGLNYTGDGYGTTVAKKTILAVFKISNFCAPSGGSNIIITAAGSDIGDFALMVQNVGQTQFKLGLMRNNQALFPSSQITINQGTWYAVAISTNSTGPLVLWQCYDYTAQGLAANSGQVTTDITTIATPFTGDFCLNSQTSGSAIQFVGELYCAGLHSDYWDTSLNNLFPGFYTDPVSVARGSYTASGGLAAGSASLVEPTKTQVFLSAGRASGIGSGGSGSPTYQWYRDSVSNLTPGAGNLLSGATALNLTDTPPSAGPWWYKLRATDGTSTADYAQIPAVLMPFDEIKFGAVGDSITLSTSGETTMMGFFRKAALASGRRCTVVNMGVSGSSAQSATTSLSWDPTVGLLLPVALSAFAAEGGITYILCMLGANDAASNKTSSQFTTDLGAVVSTLISNGYKVLLAPPPYAFSKTDVQNELLREYGAVSVPAVATANPGNCFALPASMFFQGANDHRDFSDGLHPTNTVGTSFAGIQRWNDVAQALGLTATGSFPVLGCGFIKGV